MPDCCLQCGRTLTQADPHPPLLLAPHRAMCQVCWGRWMDEVARACPYRTPSRGLDGDPVDLVAP